MKKFIFLFLFIAGIWALPYIAHAEIYRRGDLNLICEPSCPKMLHGRNRIRKISRFFLTTLTQLEKNHAVPIQKEFKPLNLHITNGTTCRNFIKKYEPNPAFSFAFFDENNKLIICLNATPEQLLKNSPHFEQVLPQIIDPGHAAPIVFPDAEA